MFEIFLVFTFLLPQVIFAAEKVTVFAAASTTNMINEVLSVYNKKGGNAVGSYGSSGALVKQIQSGAPAGIFISANQKWMNNLEKSNLIDKSTRKNLVKNRVNMQSRLLQNLDTGRLYKKTL